MEAAAMNNPESRIRFCKFEQKSEDYSPKLDQFPIQNRPNTDIRRTYPVAFRAVLTPVCLRRYSHGSMHSTIQRTSNSKRSSKMPGVPRKQWWLPLKPVLLQRSAAPKGNKSHIFYKDTQCRITAYQNRKIRIVQPHRVEKSRAICRVGRRAGHKAPGPPRSFSVPRMG